MADTPTPSPLTCALCDDSAGGPDRPDWLTPLTDPRNEQILVAAFELFAERGLHNVTMLEVATRARVSKETLYDRFENKEGLFYAMLAWGGRVVALQQAHYLQDASTPPQVLLHKLVEVCLAKLFNTESIEVTRIAYAEAKRSPEIAREFDLSVNAALREALEVLGQRLEAAGIARIESLKEFADVFIGLVKGGRHQAVLLGSEPIPTLSDIEKQAGAITARLLKAFAP